MLSLIIYVLLIFGILMGLKRGFVLQVFHLVGFIVAFIVATMYYDRLAPYLTLWVPYPDLSGDSTWAAFVQNIPVEEGFYNGISFVAIFFATKIVLQIIASMLDFVASLPVIGLVNRIGGAILGFVEVYAILFFILFILALAPFEFAQTWINDSSIALRIIEETPYLSEKISELWFSLTGDEIMKK
ncbi:CvpA family protein [Ornithinibacillus sp. 4-3]|uniref:CvpA family protein n=1 Tax=Ornithinibacillus sp. 4-3 TaxID=3231488 RepID=A0AB39HI35_9BACI